MYSRCASQSVHPLLQGVSWCRIMKKWRAQFGYGGKCRNLGYFDDPADAVSTILCCTRLCVLNKPTAASGQLLVCQVASRRPLLTDCAAVSVKASIMS
jgi:hypothetical protein